MMIFEEEKASDDQEIDAGIELNLFPEFYDQTFDGIEELPGSEPVDNFGGSYEEFKAEF